MHQSFNHQKNEPEIFGITLPSQQCRKTLMAKIQSIQSTRDEVIALEAFGYVQALQDLGYVTASDAKILATAFRTKIEESASKSSGFTDSPQTGIASANQHARALDDDNCGNCQKCYRGRSLFPGGPQALDRMLTCPECGNKRCPKASDHDRSCTGSNEPGQPGSVYP